MDLKIDVSNVILHTKNLTLRAFLATDLDDFYNYAKVKGVGEMAGWHAHRSIAETKIVLDMFIENKNNFAVVYKDKVIGSFGLNTYDKKIFPEFDDKKVVHIGFVITKDFWGRGFATEICKCVIEYIFTETAADLILTSAFNINTRSQRVQEKCGLKKYKTYLLETPATTAQATARVLTRERYEVLLRNA